ncbi:ribosomal large subunit pseudouridine synthase B [Secundilactobacillus pentosiphilus]|uniref:Pseudouridine synthase n=1 Tax=Secundilactobacillus pentosiphilus TaxID=1714682 RepID=A0A1Z5IVR8_9LACO|nr:pseudouridine synthase [Secundilactobacillus pentosiphilus]GAX02901.1 ribosomal large subunit pseudouridine synthase B [Secundilactobacillus pentosiphilus]GAX05890.1 ribosomal large subunit pseudouridine synthase B [Secundilactobacillus pentosiphilus]
MERLQKVMAHAGVASRRSSEKLITTGHVKVNGKKVTELGTKVSKHDHVTVDEMPIQTEMPIYLLMDKPRQVVSTVHDDKHRKTVIDLLDDEIKERVYPVGRLDYDTTGLLLLTNDGELANQLTHPKYEVEKTYVAKVEGIPTNEELKHLRQGVRIDGKLTSPAKSKLLSSDEKRQTAIVSLTIHEGKNHQVKKMLQAIGHPVMKLKRETYAFLTLKGVLPGEFRELNPEEVKELKRVAHLDK